MVREKVPSTPRASRVGRFSYIDTNETKLSCRTGASNFWASSALVSAAAGSSTRTRSRATARVSGAASPSSSGRTSIEVGAA